MASLLLRGSNSNAPVKTVTTPGGVGGKRETQNDVPSGAACCRLRGDNSRFMLMFGVLYMKCMKSWVVLMRIWSPL